MPQERDWGDLRPDTGTRPGDWLLVAWVNFGVLVIVVAVVALILDWTGVI